MQRQSRILGIEGGGTKTEWILAEGDLTQDSVIASGQLPAANLRLISDEALLQLLSTLPQDVSHVGAYLAGCGSEEDGARLRALVRKVWPGAKLAIGSDRDSGMAAAFGDGDGIAVIAGTGAAVHGRKGDREEKAGGWGQMLGDRGSGYDLAMQGLRLVLTHYDLNQRITPLAQEILQILALNRLADLVGWAMQADKMSVAQLAPAIFHAAKFGEPEMLATVQAGADVLAEFTRAVAQRLEFPKATVKLLGGLFTHQESYVALFKYRLSILLPDARVEVCNTSGALGAAWLAERSAGRSSGVPPAGSGTTGRTPELRHRQSRANDTGANLNSAASLASNNGGSNGEPAEADAPPIPADLVRLASAPTEQSNPRSANLENRATPDLVDLFISEEDSVAQALGSCRESLICAIDIVSAAMQNGGRLFYIGAGTSGRLGVLDASEIPPTFGSPPDLVQGIIAGGAEALHRAVEGAEDQAEGGAQAVLERGVRQGDVVCGLTASGRTPFVLGGLSRARSLNARTILISCNPANAPAPSPWDALVALPTGPEIITGSTRLKAGTATKVALNMISTIAMIRLGRVRGNAMVDLQITNAKLQDRGARLISQTLGIEYSEARARLERAGWNVRKCLEEERPAKSLA